MAIISMFYGIIISMYYLDNKRHNLPHIHVKYQDEEAVISIIDGQLLEGTLKSNKMKLVQAWIDLDAQLHTFYQNVGAFRQVGMYQTLFVSLYNSKSTLFIDSEDKQAK